MLDNEWMLWAGLALLLAGLYFWSQSRLERAKRERDRALALAEEWRVEALYWKNRLAVRAFADFTSSTRPPTLPQAARSTNCQCNLCVPPPASGFHPDVQAETIALLPEETREMPAVLPYANGTPGAVGTDVTGEAESKVIYPRLS